MSEEIIIDGVEVEGCIFLCKPRSDYLCRIFGEMPTKVNQFCSKNNCYYKQLKRLEQKYNEILKLAKQNADSNEYCLQELEKENDNLREAMHKDFCSHYVLGECSQEHHNNCIGRNQCIKDLEKENEELKKKNRDLEYSLTFGNYDLVRDKNIECKDLKKENKRLAEIVKDLANKNQKYENDINIKVLQKELDEALKKNKYYLDCLYKLENALEEIKEIADKMYSNDEDEQTFWYKKINELIDEVLK